MRVGELVGEPRLAHPGLAHDGGHLAVAGTGLVEDPAQVLDLGVATDEARESATGACLETSPRRAGSRHLVNFHRVSQPLHRHGAERLHLDLAFGQRQRIGRDHDRAGIGDLLHPRGKVSGLPHRGVIHV